ncbi:GntR family transcriptional regulator [Rhizobiaceae bacterium n13]|uniref:GntR family transcriptional regulator n=1 Tax=Ferirhizobium litorale TaxID=2927786 RepID=A0AAE3QEZ2_9HYPH|nr:GntR family transcriptional regulator [Fererhizobium litorale]MDI7862642.1 GntR family transcriptional regulator [Fererhizobium litorale]MDI7923875.1 GntR family transcriptional regulator [Fererhizobium litorale]
MLNKTRELQEAVSPTAEVESFQPLHERMRDDIINGALPEGSWLKTHDLGRRYGVSTNPIREALHQLSGEGFVVIHRNRGARVRTLDEDFVRNIFDIRALIEPYLVRLFVEQASESDLRAMEEVQLQIEMKPEDQIELDRLDEAFHGIMYDRHFNQEALAIRQRHGEVVRGLARRYPVSPARRIAMIEEHRAIMEAVARHDVEGTQQIVEKHARAAERNLIQRMRQAQL